MPCHLHVSISVFKSPYFKLARHTTLPTISTILLRPISASCTQSKVPWPCYEQFCTTGASNAALQKINSASLWNRRRQFDPFFSIYSAWTLYPLLRKKKFLPFKIARDDIAFFLIIHLHKFHAGGKSDVSRRTSVFRLVLYSPPPSPLFQRYPINGGRGGTGPTEIR